MKYLPFLPLAILLGAPLAGAAPVTFTYRSTTDASAEGGPVNDPVTLTYTIDSTLANGTGDLAIDSQHGSYGPWNGTLTVGNQTVKLTGGTIDTWNDIAIPYGAGSGPMEDGYDIQWDSGYASTFFGGSSSGKLFGHALDFFRILIVDDNATMLSSNALPTNASFAPQVNYYIQDEFDLADGLALGHTEFLPPGRPYSLSSGNGTSVSSATQYWDGKGAANDGIITGGSGTWNATAANWTGTGGTSNGRWLGGTAVFGGTPGKVTLGGPISATGLMFQMDGYVIAGSSALTLTGQLPTLTMNGSATIAAPIAGKNGVIVDGPATLTLTNSANSYSGGTTVATGLQIGTATATGSIGAGDITIDGGATLTVVNTKGNRITNMITTDGGVGTLVMDSAQTITLAGPLLEGDLFQSGGGQLALTQSGPGTTIVANGPDDFFNGAISVTRGTLQFGTASNAGFAGYNLGPQIAVSGTGTFKLVNIGLSTASYEPALGALGKETTQQAQFFVTDIVDGAGGTVLLSPSSTMQVGGVISGAGSVTMVGATPLDGALLPGMASSTVAAILTGNNTYTGPTTVNSGILQIGDGNSGSLAPASAVTVKPMAVLALDLPAGGNLANTVTNNGRVYFMGPNNYEVSAAISGTGSVVKTGSGVTKLSGYNTYTGGTTLNAGTLLADSHDGSATGKGPVTVNSGATLGGNGTISGPVTLNSGGTIFPSASYSGIPGLGLSLSSLTWQGGSTLSFAVGNTGIDLIQLSGPLTKTGSGPWNIDLVYNGSYINPNAPESGALLTFSSTNFKLSDFHLELPPGLTGMLVETKTSLMLEDVTSVSTQSFDSGAGGATLTLNGGLGYYGGVGGAVISLGGYSYGGTLSFGGSSLYAGSYDWNTGGLVISNTVISAANIETATVLGAGVGATTVSAVEENPVTVNNVGGFTAAPEPGSALLMVLGGGALLGWRRRRVGD
jgi:autotransporter-associated beta strand protein